MDREVTCVRPEGEEEINSFTREKLAAEDEEEEAEDQEEEEAAVSSAEALKMAKSLRLFVEKHQINLDMELIVDRIENFRLSEPIKIQKTLIDFFKKGGQ